MNNDPKPPMFPLILIAVVCFIVGFGFGNLIGRTEGYEDCQKFAVKLGLARWDSDPQTGAPAFIWKKD